MLDRNRIPPRTLAYLFVIRGENVGICILVGR